MSSRKPIAPFIDFQELLDRVDNDRQLLYELFSIFKDDFPGSLAKLRDAVTRGDLAEIARLSHTLKGTLGNLAADPAMNSAARLEQTARAGQAAQLTAALADFERNANSTLTELETYMAEARPA